MARWGPVLPTDFPCFQDDLMFETRGRFFRTQAGDVLMNEPQIPLRNMRNKVAVDKLGAVFAVITRIGLVDVGKPAVRQVAADEFRLIFKYGSVTGFAVAQGSERLFAFRDVPRNDGHPHGVDALVGIGVQSVSIGGVVIFILELDGLAGFNDVIDPALAPGNQFLGQYIENTGSDKLFGSRFEPQRA